MTKKRSTASDPLTPTDIAIREIRGHRVLLDSDLAAIYGVATSRFNEAIKRNRARFPADFMFQLSKEEAEASTSQIAILNSDGSTSPKAVAKPGRGRHRKYLPYAFTEHGALQAANILKSERAVAMSVFVVRAFIKQREVLMAQADVLKRLAQIDAKLLQHDDILRVIWRELQPFINPAPSPPKPRIGFKS